MQEWQKARHENSLTLCMLCIRNWNDRECIRIFVAGTGSGYRSQTFNPHLILIRNQFYLHLANQRTASHSRNQEDKPCTAHARPRLGSCIVFSIAAVPCQIHDAGDISQCNNRQRHHRGVEVRSSGAYRELKRTELTASGSRQYNHHHDRHHSVLLRNKSYGLLQCYAISPLTLINFPSTWLATRLD
jgi:hypothetical protein